MATGTDAWIGSRKGEQRGVVVNALSCGCMRSHTTLGANEQQSLEKQRLEVSTGPVPPPAGNLACKETRMQI